MFFVGRGIDYAVCLEGSLKLKEISYIHSEAYAAGELKHGTISLIEQGTLVIGVLTQSELYEKTISNMLECKEKLYGDYADEILTREDFLNYNELYSKRIEEYDRKITELEAERQNLQTAPNAYPFLDVYRKYRKLEEITRPMVVELIEKIEVYEGNRVEIMFRFQDEIADLLEELHQKQHEVSA